MAADEWRPYQISMASFIKFFQKIGAARRKNAQGGSLELLKFAAATIFFPPT
jgi:hypothetical protein